MPNPAMTMSEHDGESEEERIRRCVDSFRLPDFSDHGGQSDEERKEEVDSWPSFHEDLILTRSSDTNLQSPTMEDLISSSSSSGTGRLSHRPQLSPPSPDTSSTARRSSIDPPEQIVKNVAPKHPRPATNRNRNRKKTTSGSRGEAFSQEDLNQLKLFLSKSQETNTTARGSIDPPEEGDKIIATQKPKPASNLNPIKTSRISTTKVAAIKPKEQEAEHEDQRHRERRKHRETLRFIGALIFAGSVLTVGLSFALVLVLGQLKTSATVAIQTAAPSISPTALPTMDTFYSLVEGLLKTTLQKIRNEPKSPQAKAYSWIENDPYLGNYTDANIRQRFAFLTLYYSTNGDSWATPPHWLDYQLSECETVPFPLTTCNESDQMIGIYLSDNLLRGPLPPEIGLLTTVQELILSNNKIRGSLPTEIGLLSQLDILSVDNNHMTGSLPTELGLLSLIRKVVLFDNGFQGMLPTEIGSMTNLTDWDMHETSINGPIPTEIGNWKLLENISTWNAPLTGNLPSQMGQLTQLRYLAMQNGGLSGLLPTELGLLSNLQHLQLDLHNLTGPVPSELGQLHELRILSLGVNRLVSSLPSEIGLLSDNLQVLRFHDNQLTGPIPTELGLFSWLESLELDVNQLSQSIPSELGQAAALIHLFLARNQLTGTLPTELGGLVHLEAMRLHYNDLIVGSIPIEWDIMGGRNLSELNLIGVGISGSIPNGLCNLDRLLILCHDYLCGCNCTEC